jgi:type VI secretion system protein ImpK
MPTPPEQLPPSADATVLRPRPGQRHAGAPASAAPSAAASQATVLSTAGDPGGLDLAQYVAGSRNALLQAAVPLLVLAGRTRGQVANTDVESLRRQCAQEIRTFEDRARRSAVSAEDILDAQYALCTAIDEAFLSTPWGAQSGWAAQSLLVTFYHESQGGEKFFQILDRLLAEPQRYLALLELYYACLALGLEGRYRLDPRGSASLFDIRRDLFQRIEQLRGRSEAELSPRWKGVQDQRNAVLRLVPLWVVAAATAAILIGAWLVFDTRLRALSAPLNLALANVGVQHLEPQTPHTAAPPSGLAERLQDERGRGLVTVTDQNDGTLVRITEPNLFASGSADVNTQDTDLVHRIGVALGAVPGRILVTGHTDDRPVHSLKFHDNYELSRARAATVAALLKDKVRDGSRIIMAGKSDSDPIALPPDTTEHRAQNRRVDILLLRGE